MPKYYFIDENGFIVSHPSDLQECDSQIVNQPQTSPEIEKKDARPFSRYDLVQCKFCSSKVNPTRMQTHIIKVHLKKNGIANKEPAAGEKSQLAETVMCRLCNNPVSKKKFGNHIMQLHESVFLALKKGEKTFCPLCNQPTQNLRDHLTQKHKISFQLENIEDGDIQKNNKVELKPTYPKASPSIVLSVESLRQSFDEKQDGSKGLGHMRREWDGKFGSFPLHDDYSDEGDG